MDKPDYLDRKLGILTAHSQVPSTEVNPQGLGMLTHPPGALEQCVHFTRGERAVVLGKNACVHLIG